MMIQTYKCLGVKHGVCHVRLLSLPHTLSIILGKKKKLKLAIYFLCDVDLQTLSEQNYRLNATANAKKKIALTQIKVTEDLFLINLSSN